MAKRALIIIAQNGYQDLELKGTRDGLMAAGFTIVLASKEAGVCTGKLGGTEESAVALRDVNTADYDRVAFIGGPGARELTDDSEAHRVAHAVVEAGKPLGAICIAPTILASAGILNGKKATVWNEDSYQSGYLESLGAFYVDQPVVIDGIIITADGPDSAEEFGTSFATMS
ncbi:MAG: protease [Candidatus Peribacteria bacterium]|nr:protease [Candidatus Peribacteria bacterium]